MGDIRNSFKKDRRVVVHKSSPGSVCSGCATKLGIRRIVQYPFSTSSFALKHFKIVAAPANFTPFTYTTEGDQAKFVLLDSPNDYPIEFTGGACWGELTNVPSLIDKNITLYFKSAITTGPGADFSALFSLSGPTYTVNELLCLYRNNTDATQMKLVVGSNATNYANTNISGFTGIGFYSQVFLSIKTNDELDVAIYDHYGTEIYTATVAIDSSQFGTNFTEWSLNHKANDPTTGRPQIADKAGYWAKTLTTQERTDWVAANAAEAPVYTAFEYEVLGAMGDFIGRVNVYPYSIGNATKCTTRVLYQSGATTLALAYGTGGTATIPLETVVTWSTSMIGVFINVFVVISSEGLRLVMHKSGETVYNNLWAIDMSSFLSNHNEFRMIGKTGSIVNKARACTMASAGWYNYVMTDAQMLAASTY
jgi:hypothetical protein